MKDSSDKQPKPRQRAGVKPDDGQAAEARRILKRAERDAETVGTSAFARTADSTRRDVTGEAAGEDDAIELWGKRIGRGLGAIAIAWLLYHLVTTYVLPQ